MTYYIRVTHHDSLVFATEFTCEGGPESEEFKGQLDKYANMLGSTGAEIVIRVYELTADKSISTYTVESTS